MKQIAIVFPGQGSQYPGMGSDLLNHAIFKTRMNQVAELLKMDLKDLFKLNTTDTTMMQPYIYGLSVALYEMLQDTYQLEPMLFAGHSLGEYAALTVANCISFDEGLEIVKRRSELMGESSKGTMAAILGACSTEIEAICESVAKETKGIVTVGNYNSFSQHVISGDEETVKKVSDLMIKQKKALRIIPLHVDGAFHSELMHVANMKFQEVLSNHSFKRPNSQVVMNVSGEIQEEPMAIVEQLTKQMVSPVLWKKSMETVMNQKPRVIIEVGPGRTLAGLIKTIDRTQQVINVGNKQQLLQFAKYWRRLELV